ncbi:hypothetical protein EBU99_08815 [bacterium]|nr:hypothetical protein [bacterium]
MLLPVTLFSFPAQAEIVSLFEAASGLTLANVSGLDKRSDSYTATFDLRWLSFRKRTYAWTGEYNYAKSAKYNRAAYQQTKLGIQYYPFALGADFEDTYESVLVRYSSFLKPYLGASFGFGRFLILPVDAVAAAELSADYLVFGGALGSTLQLSKSISADLATDVGLAMSNSAVAFNGLMIRLRAGVMFAL